MRPALAAADDVLKGALAERAANVFGCRTSPTAPSARGKKPFPSLLPVEPLRPNLLNRSVRQANKIKQRLGGNGGMDSLFPPRPKGMRRRTYERLREQAVDAEERSNNALLPHVVRFLAAPNKSKDKRSFWK